MLSLRTMLDPKRAKGIAARIGFHLGAETLLARLSHGRIEIARGALDEADLIFAGTPPVLAAAIYGGQPLRALEAAGALRIEGDRALAERFVTLFPLPPKVARPD
jgi:ubiquinone biosynthesis protein UbiJ